MFPSALLKKGWLGSGLTLRDISPEPPTQAEVDSPWSSRPPQNADYPSLVGYYVEVNSENQTLDRVLVEAAIQDGQILWLAMEACSPCRLIEKLPGTSLTLIC